MRDPHHVRPALHLLCSAAPADSYCASASGVRPESACAPAESSAASASRGAACVKPACKPSTTLSSSVVELQEVNVFWSSRRASRHHHRTAADDDGRWAGLYAVIRRTRASRSISRPQGPPRPTLDKRANHFRIEDSTATPRACDSSGRTALANPSSPTAGYSAWATTAITTRIGTPTGGSQESSRRATSRIQLRPTGA